MPNGNALLLMLGAASLVNLHAQNRGQIRMPTGPSVGASAFFYQIPVRDMSKLENRPVLSKAVAVEDLGIRIPPPPPSVDTALTGFRGIQEETALSLAFLNKELTQLRKDQRDGLLLLETHPDLIPPGTDSEFFKALLELSRGEETLRARQAFMKACTQAADEKEAADDRAAELVELMWKSAILGNETWARESRQGIPVGPRSGGLEMIWAKRAQGSMNMNTMNGMLAKYGRAWDDYSRAITRFVDRVADTLKVPEKDLPPSTMLLVRLLKIQVFRIYRLQIEEQVQVWAQAARVGNRPRADPDSMGADRH
ncbi:MAG TPA: hypothetical protein VJ549_09955 [Geothrix sp.]|nr:hypothetical protein [Geothrix sp.]